MSAYWILDGDLREAGPLIAGASEPLEPLGWLSGAWRALPDQPLELRLTAGDGGWPDLATYLVPLVSDRLRALLERERVDNLQYRRVTLRDHHGRAARACWIANVLGLVAAEVRAEPAAEPDFALDAARRAPAPASGRRGPRRPPARRRGARRAPAAAGSLR